MGVLDLFRRKPAGEVKVRWGPCCFCGKDIEASDTHPCRLTMETASEQWQVWFCHAMCFKSRISTAEDIDLSPAHF